MVRRGTVIVVAADYVPAAKVENQIEDGEDGPEPLAPLNNAALAALRVEAEKDGKKEVRQLRLGALNFIISSGSTCQWYRGKRKVSTLTMQKRI